jgi:hypothetical protein
MKMYPHMDAFPYVCRGEGILSNPGLRVTERVRKRKEKGDVDKMVCGRIQYLAFKEYHCGLFGSTFSLKVISTRIFMQLLRDFAYRRKTCVNTISVVRKYAVGDRLYKMAGNIRIT